jgi:hypothetical protein
MNKDLIIVVNHTYIDSKNPGPSHYDLKPLINGKGSNFLSKYKNNLAPTMSPKLKDTTINISKVI